MGFDYTFGKHVYVQAQYLRGFINEFGAGHIGNYVVGGTDLIFFGRKLVFRAFGFRCEMVDASGRVVWSSRTPMTGMVTMDLGHLPAGTHTAIIGNDRAHRTERVVIER